MFSDLHTYVKENLTPTLSCKEREDRQKEDVMAKESTKVFVKYIPRPGRPERMNIGGRFFNSNPRLEQSRYGDLIDVEFMERYRDALDDAGWLIFDAKGVSATIKDFLRSLPKDELRDARNAAKDLGTAVEEMAAPATAEKPDGLFA